MTQWKKMQDHPLYEISDDGRVRVLKENGSYRPVKTPPGPIYLSFNVREGTRKLKYHLHREMLKLFKPSDNPKHKIVCFKNGDHLDLRIENLYWTNRAERMARRKKEGKYVTGEKHYKAKLTDNQVREIKKLLVEGKGIKELVTQFGASYNIIYYIKIGKYWKNI